MPQTGRYSRVQIVGRGSTHWTSEASMGTSPGPLIEAQANPTAVETMTRLAGTNEYVFQSNVLRNKCSCVAMRRM